MTTANIITRQSGVFLGILLTSVAYLLFSAQDAAAKYTIESISVWQVMFFRSTVIVLGCALAGRGPLINRTLGSRAFKPMFWRSVLILGAWVCYYAASTHLQLAEMTTIYFAAPVIITVLSVFILKEAVTPLRWISTGLGFLGVVVACDVTSLGMSAPVLLVLAAALLWACAAVMMRRMASMESSVVQLLLSNAFFVGFSAVPLVFLWKTPDLQQTLLLVAIGVIGGLGQLAMFEGIKRADASVVAPLEYTSLIWSFIFGYLIWGDTPRQAVIGGAVLIVAAGLLIILSEHLRLRRRKPPAGT